MPAGAREARASELRAEAEEKALEIEELHAKRRHLERLALDGEGLLAGHTIWLGGNPAPELADVRRKLTEAEAQIERLRGEAAQHAESSRALRPRIDGLRGLLSEAFLLDPPDHADRVRSIEAEHQSALAAQAEVARVSRLAEIVDTDLSVLRSRPLEDDELASLRRRVGELRRQRERLDAAVDALEYVRTNAEALGWSEAPRRLADNQALVPALEAQLDEAKVGQEAAERAADAADARYVELTTEWQDADRRRIVATQEHTAAATRFESLGPPKMSLALPAKRSRTSKASCVPRTPVVTSLSAPAEVRKPPAGRPRSARRRPKRSLPASVAKPSRPLPVGSGCASVP